MNLLTNFVFLAEGDAGANEGGMPSWVMWVILGVAFVLMIAMTIIPRRKQQKQTQMLMDNLKVGDKVMTIGRIVGVITEVDNATNTVTIKSGEGDNASILVIDKLAVGMVIPPNQPAAEPVKKEEVKEEEPVIEKTAKENKVADLLKKQKKEVKGDAFEEVAEEVKAEPVVEEAVVEEVKSEPVVEEAVVEEVKSEPVVEEVKAEEVAEEVKPEEK